jgi:hypothetical protein
MNNQATHYLQKNPLVVLGVFCVSLMIVGCQQPLSNDKAPKKMIEQRLIPKGATKVVLLLKEASYQEYEFTDDAGNPIPDDSNLARRVTLNDAGKTSCYECPDSVNPAKDGFGKCKSVTCCGPGISCGPLSTVISVDQASTSEPLIRSIQFVVEKVE